MAGWRNARWLWLSLAVLAADRASKAAIEACTTEDLRRAIFPGVITLVHSHNPGIAFGLLAENRSRWLAVALIASSAVVIALLVSLLLTDRAGGRSGRTGMAFILGGAAGNLLDRLLRGSVTDFLEVRIGHFHWPAFNLADSAITIGAALVVLELLLGRGDRRQSWSEKT